MHRIHPNAPLIGYIILAAGMLIGFYFISVLADRAEDDRRTARLVVCQQINGLKRDDQKAIDLSLRTTVDYLHEHPQGAPSAGISLALIKKGIVQSLAKRASKDGIDCIKFADDPTRVETVRTPLPPDLQADINRIMKEKR